MLLHVIMKHWCSHSKALHAFLCPSSAPAHSASTEFRKTDFSFHFLADWCQLLPIYHLETTIPNTNWLKFGTWVSIITCRAWSWTLCLKHITGGVGSDPWLALLAVYSHSSIVFTSCLRHPPCKQSRHAESADAALQIQLVGFKETPVKPLPGSAHKHLNAAKTKIWIVHL